MSAIEIRADLIQRIGKMDERFLKAVHLMVSSYQEEDPIVGYDIDGTPIYASVAKIQFAEDLSKQDEFMSLEDFEKELKAV